MKLLTEFVGTFIFLFVISLVAASGTPFAPVAIGCALMIMVYMGGHISGGHYNPAVSTAVLMRGKLDTKDYAPYMATQVAAGILAFYLGYWISGVAPGIAPGSEVPIYKALIVEFVFAFALCLVVLNVATSRKTEGNSFYGLAIGFTIVVAAFAGGPVSGGAFNPAVGIGATVVKAIADGGEWTNLWIYIVGPLAGAVAAAMVFKAQEPSSEQGAQ